jgi:RHS repeat-associated protein
MVLGRVGTTGKGICGCVSSVSGPPYFCMEWNAEGQLMRVLLNSNKVARFSYDPLGRRVEKVAGGVTTSYTYDGEDILREIRGATTLKYVHGPGIDEPLAQEDGSGVLTYYHTDALGSIVRRTNAAGAVASEHRYDVWGNIETGGTEPGYSYTGREWEPETGLYYYRARYYDPEGGRFISEDPIGTQGALNLYGYAAGDPALLTDPSGLKATVKLSVLPTPPWQSATRTCVPGAPAATCVIRAEMLSLSKCEERCGGWAFDVEFEVVLQQQFTRSPSDPAPESPGKTLQQHEDMHLADFRDWFSDAEVNKEIKTEGFASERACEDARRLVPYDFRIYVILGQAWTYRLRDSR